MDNNNLKLQHDVNVNVNKILTELFELHKEEAKSRKSLHDLININNKQLNRLQGLVDVITVKLLKQTNKQ